MYFLAALRIGKELGEPCHCRHELDADADEDETAQHEQHLDGRRKAGHECRERVNEDAVGQDAAASEAIGEVAANQPEDATGKGGDIEQASHPHLKLRGTWRGAGQFEQRRTYDQRQHQNFVDVEGEANRGDRADQPLNRRQPPRELYRSVLHGLDTRMRVIKFTSRWCRSSSTLGRA